MVFYATEKHPFIALYLLSYFACRWVLDWAIFAARMRKDGWPITWFSVFICNLPMFPCAYRCTDAWQPFTGTHTTGESLFTFFASLTFSFHFLTKLFELCLWILKDYNIFIYHWKLEPDILNNSENRFEQLKTYLITKNVMQQFCSFRMLLFSLLFLEKIKNLQELLKLTSSFYFWT